MDTNKGKEKQKENMNRKKEKLDREEFGFGYDISANDLNIKGQNRSAKSNIKREPNHPTNNDQK
ncbi:MAG: hypothetical protein ABWY25_12880 [Paenisporosarcina sp.]